jgi:hypothetical protein
MRILPVLFVTCYAEFYLRMQLCSDKNRQPSIINEGTGALGKFFVQIDDEEEIKIWLKVNQISVGWIVLETDPLPGDLETAKKVKFRYTHRDILCLELLELQTIDRSKTFDIIQVKLQSTDKLGCEMDHQNLFLVYSKLLYAAINFETFDIKKYVLIMIFRVGSTWDDYALGTKSHLEPICTWDHDGLGTNMHLGPTLTWDQKVNI